MAWAREKLSFRAAAHGDGIGNFWTRFLSPFGTETDSGIPVNEKNALKYSAVWSAVNIISGAVGYLPLQVFERTENGKRKIPDNHVYKLLHDRPNPTMAPLTFRQTITAHVLLWGNGYAWIERDNASMPVALWPLDPSTIEPELDRDLGLIIYRQRVNGAPDRTVFGFDMIHILGLGFDGVRGYGVIQFMRENIGASLAVEKFGAKLFANGAKTSGVLTYPGELSAEGLANLRESFAKKYQGNENAHKPIVLESGATFTPNSINPDDAQFLETKEFGTSDIARWFQIPPHMLANLKDATFSNIEHQGQEFVTMALLVWLTRWEQELNYKMFVSANRGRLFAEFNVNALVRGDIKTRFAAYQTAIMAGWLTRNEARQLENLNSLEGLDEPLQPLNMVPVGEEPAPAEPAEPTEPAPEEDDARCAPLILETARRLVTKELGALRKAVARDDFNAADFYAGYRLHMERVLVPVAQALGDEGRAVLQARDYTSARALAVARILANGQAPQIQKLIDCWETELPDAIARRMLPCPK